MRSKKGSCSLPYRRRKKHSRSRNSGNVEIITFFCRGILLCFQFSSVTSSQQYNESYLRVRVGRTSCNRRRTHGLLKMIAKFRWILVGGWTFFFAPLYVSKTPDKTDKITFRWLISYTIKNLTQKQLCRQEDNNPFFSEE